MATEWLLYLPTASLTSSSVIPHFSGQTTNLEPKLERNFTISTKDAVDPLPSLIVSLREVA
jgi:hypothetical protein